jgi:hypothetical protein
MMQFPRFLDTAAAVALTFSATLGGAQGLPGYAPSKVTYKVTNSVATMQNMMGNMQTSETNADQELTIAVVKDGTGLKYMMTLDAASAKSSNPMVPVPDMSEILGTTVTGAMAPDGKVEKFEVMGKGGTPSTSPLAGTLRPMLPRLKVGAKLGDSWNDSATVTQKQNGADVKTTTQSVSKYVSDTTINGVKGHKITVTSTGTVSGSGSQMGADFSINGTSKSTSTIVVGADGVLLGLMSDGASDMMIEVPQAQMSIPMQMKNTTVMAKKN